MRKKARTTHKRQTGTTKDAPTVTKEQPQPLTVRFGKRAVDKPFGDRQPKHRIRVSGNPKSPSMSRKNKEAAEQKDVEQDQPEEPSSLGKIETQSLLLRIENLEN